MLRRLFSGLVGLAGLGGLALVGACSGDDDSGSSGCTPNEAVQCVGPGNCAGVRVCAADGSGFSQCVCGSGQGGSGQGGSGQGGSGQGGSGPQGGNGGFGATPAQGGASGGPGQGGTAGSGPGQGGSGPGQGGSGPSQGGAGAVGGSGPGQGGSGAFGGSGGSGGAPAAPVGGPCLSAADCPQGLTCLTPDGTDLDGQGTPQGVCTLDCLADATVCGGTNVCVTYQTDDTGAATQAWCMEGCAQGTVPFDADQSDWFPPTHCNGRFEFACARLGEAGNEVDVCLPACVSDSDCGSGFCDLGTGSCSASQPTGLPLGADCDPTAADDPCAGACIGTDPDDSSIGFCSGVCTLGTLGLPGGCGSNPSQGTPQTGICAFGSSEFSEVGDLGFCTNTCDCTANCAQGFFCLEITNLQGFTLFPGICVGGAPDTTSNPPDVELTQCPSG